MTDIFFDTMAAVRRLRETGLDEKQAEAITATVRDGVTGGVATKADLTKLEGNIAKLEIELKAELKWLKLIGGAILAVLILPWLAKLISSTMPIL